MARRKYPTGVNVRHGGSLGGIKTPEYSAWLHMRERCFNPNNSRYARYGGRGITICERWNAYENFSVDMGLRPSPQHSIERINNDGNYEPSNCKWATRKEQQQNIVHARLITFNGQTLCLSEWARRLGSCAGTLTGRIKRGWPLERVLTPPLELGARLHVKRRSASSAGRS
jgi:hypothetical protein